jgi:predicted ATPase
MIQSLELRNFKCFRRQVIEFSPLTLLTGINGTGKSTVLQALLLLRQSYLKGTLPVHGLLLNGDLADLGTAGDVLFRSADEDEIGIVLEVDAHSLPWKFHYDNQHANVIKVTDGPAVSPETVLFSSNVHYLMAERIGPRAMYEMSSYAVEQENQIGKDGRFAIAYLEANSTREVNPLLQIATATSTNVRAQTEGWISEISPGTHLEIQPYPQLNRLTLGMTFSEVGTTGRPFTAPNVGFGLSYVLPVIVAILASPPNSLIMIENPEAHLHPKGQVAMGRLLSLAAMAGLQIIVETHSDHILNGVRITAKKGEVAPSSVAIRYFDRSIAEGSISHVVHTPKLNADGRIDNWPPGFFDQWEQSLDALLT